MFRHVQTLGQLGGSACRAQASHRVRLMPVALLPDGGGRPDIRCTDGGALCDAATFQAYCRSIICSLGGESAAGRMCKDKRKNAASSLRRNAIGKLGNVPSPPAIEAAQTAVMPACPLRTPRAPPLHLRTSHYFKLRCSEVLIYPTATKWKWMLTSSRPLAPHRRQHDGRPRTFVFLRDTPLVGTCAEPFLAILVMLSHLCHMSRPGCRKNAPCRRARIQ